MKNKKMRPYTVMCTDIYLLVMLVIFPLYYADGYFHLPQRKAEFFSIATLIYIIVCALGVAIDAFSMRERWNLESFKKNITGTDICMFGFLVSNVIALTMSNDVATSWSGVGGRYYGAQVLILVCIAYFLVSRYGWLNKVFITAFLIGGNGVCLLATFDYFGMDVLGINQQMQQWDWLIFISTMGNANTCASFVTMALAGAMVYFCVTKGIKSKIFAGISIANCGAALITARSDSAFVGIAVIIVVLAVFSAIRKIKWKDFVLTLCLLDLGLLILFLLRKKFVEYLILESFDSGLPKALNQPVLLSILFVVFAAVYGVLYIIEKKQIKIGKNTKRVSLIIAGVLVIVGVVLLIQKVNILNILKGGMGGSNKTGSRSYTYQRTLQAYGQLPLRHKIFGCGQASISGVLYQYFGDELSAAGLSINSAHNHVLDYLISTGLFGVLCYLGIVFNGIKHSFQAFSENKYALVFAGCIIAYFAQGVFNIEQTNTTTVFWLIIAFCEAMYRKNIVKKEQ